MDQNSQIASAIRSLGAALGGVLAAHGYMDATTAQIIIGAIISFGLTMWGVYAKRPAALVASAANVPDVKVIGTSTDMARAIQAQEVIPATVIPKLGEVLLAGARAAPQK